jgi:ATP-binding cassette subfamily C protein CydD
VLLLAPELYLPLRNLGAQFHASADGLAAAERVYEILDLPDAVVAPRHARRCPEPGLEPVVFREVEFGYPGRPVLHDVSFRLEPGETLALIGASGGGKTTTASLLLRLADPRSGGVLCGGVDLREVDPREWRRRIAWLPQRPTIFSASLGENVRLGAPKATDEQVLVALAAANFDLELPLDTVIGEGGRGLSFGQAQRVALARAFLRDAPLVVLDEPTAHLDAGSADQVRADVLATAAGRTTVVTSHRPEAFPGWPQLSLPGRAHDIEREPAAALLSTAANGNEGSPP